ncbi:MAG: PSD1 and planctomycete cytochrome C domain-containing protein [Verrucomicrobiota bacterium]|nr:PSD1 and planctomycete cytochrome C domain-containing protein [Verrucomicrobiota bacterium]
MTAVAAEGEDVTLFENKVRPILVEHCYECHSAEKKQKGGLLLDTKEDMLKGGDTGPAIVPGDPAKSLLVQAVRHENDLEMPPKKKLSDSQIVTLEEWVKRGAPYPQTGSRTATKMEQRLDQAKGHWAFQPLSQIAPPRVSDASWTRNEVDRFILAKLEAAGLQPSPETDPATLIRRVTLDLIGLPPTPEEVTAFVNDHTPQAYERLVDRLLASPHYGERWGRHWLDLARYADTSGVHNDLDRPHAWKYRDYVIRSFNEDKPYARFVAEQLAGDEVDSADEDSLIATGFCRNGPSNDDNMGKTDAALAQYRADQLDDVVSTMSTVFLGVTIGCARCHDHKTDPFTAKDYYGLLAVFNGTDKYGLVPGTQDRNGAKIKVDPAVQVHALVETSAVAPPTHLMRRGIATDLSEEVAPAVPVALTKRSLHFPEPDTCATTSRRRRTLTDWIASPDNALAWRVLANRIWQHHFGKGIVGTPSDFGFTGAPPTHPELLDYLAKHLIANGGRLKPLHKLIVTSATYRQSSQHRSEAADRDPANGLLWRMNLRRMEAEVVRDSILAASGKLNPQLGGPGIKPRLRPELLPASQRNKWPVVAKEDARHWRRSVYIYTKRQLLMPIMELFDAPTTTDSCAVRTESVVPTQALVLMNDEFAEEQAAFLASRARHEAGDELGQTIERIFLLAVSRPPRAERMQQALAFVQSRELESDRESALTDLAHVLFNSSEFIHIQ